MNAVQQAQQALIDQTKAEIRQLLLGELDVVEYTIGVSVNKAIGLVDEACKAFGFDTDEGFDFSDGNGWQGDVWFTKFINGRSYTFSSSGYCGGLRIEREA